jgi:16S rRNA C967 or C1407 C5-methylase (RsmB/RsmF family)/NOL1/NOP2/fmu family ribosome biogenesis protein
MQLPPEFETRMKTALGSEWAAFRQALHSAAPVSVRCNPEKKCPWSEPQIPWTRWGHYLTARPQFTLDPLFHAGAYYVQEASSMFVEQAFLQTAPLDKPIKVLDLSAAPGGKSTHLLSLMRPDDLLVANEVIRSRASVLAENIIKWGYENCIVVNNDPADYERLENFFDVILVDAPCSGEGLFRKNPESVSEWSADNVCLCSARQKRIVRDVWNALKPGGILIYSTCTYNESENEDNIIHFIQSLQADSVTLHVEAGLGIQVVEKEQMIGYRFLPHEITGEGFFLSVLRKAGDKVDHRSPRSKKSRLVPVTKNISSRLQSWVNAPDLLTFFQHNDLIFALRSSHVGDIEYILERLRFIYAGVNMATAFNEKLVPEHALALSRILNKDNFVSANLSLAETLQFLKKEAILLPDKPKGYVLICFDDTAVGWANNLIQRVNNLYPAEMKIRMEIPR